MFRSSLGDLLCCSRLFSPSPEFKKLLALGPILIRILPLSGNFVEARVKFESRYRYCAPTALDDCGKVFLCFSDDPSIPFGSLDHSSVTF
jgi:hypothetical protein